MANLFGVVVDRLLGMPEPRVEHVRRHSISVPMPDGSVLAADRYAPLGDERGPVVLIRTPYGKHTAAGRINAEVLARRGLPVIVQDVRGTFESRGEFIPFHHERADGLATVEWLREQPWCDGRVAMAGASYLGHTQWAIGPYLDPPLDAMAIGISASTFVPTFYPSGVIALYTLLTWSSGIGTQEDRFGPLLNLFKGRRIEAAMATLPLSRADRAAIDKAEPFLQEVVAHAEAGDTFWSDIEHDQGVSEVQTPTSMVAGWYDIFLPQQLKDFTALREAGAPCRLTVGPWAHGSLGMIKPMLQDQVSWLEAHLLGDPVQTRSAPVRIFLQGAQRWLDFDHWPVPAEPMDLHLAADGSVHPETTSAGERTFRYDPSDPTPTVGGVLLRGNGQRADNSAVEARPDVLVYTGERLDHDLDVIGAVSAEVFVEADNADFDVFVRICDVDGRGRSFNVTEGITRLSAAPVPADGEGGPTGGDGVRGVSVELLPTAYRFRAGHRLRVQIAGGAFPNYARNTGTGEAATVAVETRPTAIRIRHGADAPTRVTVARFDGGRGD